MSEIEDKTVELIKSIDARISATSSELSKLKFTRRFLFSSLSASAIESFQISDSGIGIISKVADILAEKGPMRPTDLAKILDIRIKNLHSLISQELKTAAPRIAKIGRRPNIQLINSDKKSL